ncbi:pentatricopeptide repeat-containing protein At4g02750-like isoform X1 [Selaginella moellendorffii]|nr:pentatricopeptide repeat-containing protein At4g02750-like isoform X1 [Selaginella moellendorffii]|eukprot:XP_024529820.1 pentatricopeptide repeat-containing protein At4g02750-like isoform X1 [Selaginella moellendorffii]
MRGRAADGSHLLVSWLRHLGDARDLGEGRKLHAHFAATGMDRGTILGNLLVRMYGSCGQVEKSLAAFARIHRKNVFSWTLLCGAYAENGHLDRSKIVFQRMPQRDMVSCTAMIGIYSQDGFLVDARRVFDEMPEKNLVPWNALVTAHAAAGMLKDARRVFEGMPGWNLVTCNSMLQGYAHHGEAWDFFHRLPVKDLISWNLVLQASSARGSLEETKGVFDRMAEWDRASWIAMVTSYAQSGKIDAAREIFEDMPEHSVASCTAMLLAYAEGGDAEEAKEIFDSVTQHDVMSWNAMIVAYAQNRALDEARSVFDKMPKRNLVSWNAMVQTHSQSSNIEEAENLFLEMKERDVISWTAMVVAYGQNGQLQESWRMFSRIPRPNIVSWNAMLSVYSLNGELQAARCVFEKMPQRNLVAWTTMITSYARSEELDNARKVFDSMPEQDTVSWTSMIATYAESGHAEIALRLFKLMDLEGFRADKVSYTSVLQACSSLVAPREGKLIHASIVQGGVVSEISVGTALINMYGKCGLLMEARTMLEKMPRHDIGSWTATIVAFAQNGCAAGAIELFQNLNLGGLVPDWIVVVSVLCACSHGGMLTDAWFFFTSAQEDYAIVPPYDLYLCMIGLLGRAGQLEQAEELIVAMPFDPDVVAWMILLSACRSIGDSRRGAVAAERVFSLEPENASAYLLLSNTHAAAGNWDDATNVRRIMSQRGIKKRPGWSYMDFFLSGREFLS